MVDELTARKTAFKVGFLAKLAEAGMTPDDFLTKLAFKGRGGSSEDVSRIVFDLAGHAKDVGARSGGWLAGQAGKALPYAGYALTGLPIAAGGGLGALEQLTEAPTSTDLEPFRQAELIGLYKQLTKEIHDRVKNRGAA